LHTLLPQTAYFVVTSSKEGNVLVRVRPFVCLSVHYQDYVHSSQAVFSKFCSMNDYGHGKNALDFAIDPTQSGRLAAILDFYYNILQ